MVISELDRRSGGKLDAVRMAEVSGLLVWAQEAGRVRLLPPVGCGCNLALGDIVSGDWKLWPELKEPIVRAVEYAGTQTKKFRFSATWRGEPAVRVEEVGLEEFIVGIRANRVSGRWLFVVQASGIPLLSG